MAKVQKKILLTAHDLEQQEHRGIAVFSKNVIKALQFLDYEVWLLTSASARLKKVTVQQILENLEISQPDLGSTSLVKRFRSSWAFQVLFPRPVKQLLRQLFSLLRARSSAERRCFDVQTLDLPQSSWSPRLSYLKHVKGFVNAPGLFGASLLRLSKNEFKSNQLTELDLNGMEFYAVITTCPLPIRFLTQALKIQVVHDLIPIQIPSEHPWDDPKIFSRRLEAACQADLVLSVSYTTARTLTAYGFEPKRFEVIYQPKSFSPQADGAGAEVTFKFPYVLSVGSIEPRKNVALAAQAFLQSELPAKGYRYIIVGELRGNPEGHTLSQLCAQSDQVIAMGHVSDQQRDLLLRHAQAFVFPSILEGYGIPLVDAIQMGKRIICSDIEVFREIADGNAHFVKACDIDKWVLAFNSIDSVSAAHPQEKFEFFSFRQALQRCIQGA